MEHGIREGCVEIIRDSNLSFVDTQRTILASLSYWDQTSDRYATVRNRDLLPTRNTLQEP